MYLLYIDESENSDSKTDKFRLTVFGLSGLVIVDKYITSFVDDFHKLKDAYNIPPNIEISGYDIFSSKRWRKILNDDERRAFCHDLVEIITKPNRIAKGFFVHKNTSSGKKNYLPCLKELVFNVGKFVSGSKTSKQFLIIFDELDELEDSISKSILSYREDVYKQIKKAKSKTCRIIDHGFPGKSKYSELLQATDFVGYVIRLSLTLQRQDTLFTKSHNEQFIDFVDELVNNLKKKVKIKEVK